MSASAIGLCQYLQKYLEGYVPRGPGTSFSWNTTFFGSLPGATSILYQNISQNASTTNGLEFAALFNARDNNTGLNNSEALAAILNATATITSWPTNGGGMIQWATSATNVNRSAGSITVPLVRSGSSILPIKVSYTTYGLTADSSNYVATSGVVGFAAGVVSQNVTIPILNNKISAASRQFSLELISASGGAWLGDRLTSIITIVDTSPAPQFVGRPSLLSNGSFQVQLTSGLGQVLTLEYSTNLLDWQTLQTFTNVSTTATITDTNAARRSRSFYRVTTP